ncbi:MAG TPA: transcription-repair coupling factor [Gammaproteobacteria bacterium]|nr:transcription-repair coupling factor [Gammaproteobacteria bacterium]
MITQTKLLIGKQLDTSVSHVKLGQLYGSSKNLAIAEILNEDLLSVIVCPNSDSAHSVFMDLRFFSNNKIDIDILPDLEMLPYDINPPIKGLKAARSETFYKLASGEIKVLVLNAQNLLWRIPEPSFFSSNAKLLRKSDEVAIHQIQDIFSRSGFERTNVVSFPGEYSIRGSIIDFYSTINQSPVRLDLLDETIDSMRCFDIESQLTIESIDSCKIVPVDFFSKTKEQIEFFKMNFRNSNEGNHMEWPLYQSIDEDYEANGAYNYLPFFHKRTVSLLDYFEPNTRFFCIGETQESLNAYQELIKSRYSDFQIEGQPMVSPENLFFQSSEVFERIINKNAIAIHEEKLISPGFIGSNQDTRPISFLFQNNEKSELANILEFKSKNNLSKILISIPSLLKRNSLIEQIKDDDLEYGIINDWFEFLESEYEVLICQKDIDQGFILKNFHLGVLTEKDVFGFKRNNKERKQLRDPESIIQNLKDLRRGSLIVHRDYGIGVYDGLNKMKIDGIDYEFIKIMYANDDLLQLPVTQLDKISRYIGDANDEKTLSKLGTDQWSKVSNKAKQKAHDVAAELLELYAFRSIETGKIQPSDTKDYQNFITDFEYVLTRDQAKTIEEVLGDLSSSKKMDRLICGDVGFGKTEVAMRAAFISAMNGNQVVIMVPTTILANQHYQSFKERFEKWPLKIALLTRSQSMKRKEVIFDSIQSGECDILIGTHAVLSDRVKFDNLGLIIVDEEHRFGVRQKELLQKLKHNVDFLAMTATPIPRTLNMAIGDLRDISMIMSAPESRVPVKTFVTDWHNSIIKEAITRELDRGGQIFLVHNKIENISTIAENIYDIFPNIKLEVAHGQMKEGNLEKIMMRFYNHEYDLLISTSIIESGIDIPNANTIIINNANLFGLSQLHQMRGRVGRSSKQAYAYLISPPKNEISDDAVKRLQAIEAVEELGIGFMLATHDLEIRGAGELLGEAQSGQIQKIGFSLFKDMLTEAVNALRSEESVDHDFQETDININIPVLIPEELISDVNLRLIFYRRISNATNKNELDQISNELVDRFGYLPDATKNLLEITNLRNKATKLGIHKIRFGSEYGRIYFSDNSMIDVDHMLKLINKNDRYRLYPDQSLGLKGDFLDEDLRKKALSEVISYLGAS